MFYPKKSELIGKLVDCWNEMARLRGEALYFRSIRGGWDWVVVLECHKYSGDVEIQVVLFGSKSDAGSFMKYAAEHPDEVSAKSVNRTFGPYMQYVKENLGFRSFDKWIDDLCGR